MELPLNHKKTRAFLVLSSVAFLAFLPSKTEAAIADGLVGHWKFDETSGAVAADSSGKANNAEVGNFAGDDPIWVAGKIGNALTFRGPGNGADYAVVADFPKTTTVFSVSAWAWADERATWPQSAIVENGFADGGPIGLVIRVKTAVAGVSENQVDLDLSVRQRFFRLKR